MEFHESDDSENDEAVFHGLRLDILPPEIILHICSYLSAKFVISVLSRVCKKFKALIENDTTWRMRIFRRWPKSYPVVPRKYLFLILALKNSIYLKHFR